MLIDPWGEVKAVLPEGEGVVSGELDPAFLAERARQPAGAAAPARCKLGAHRPMRLRL